ncbi:gliding motility-associated-like protein [Flavobacterium sp. CG_9.10]|uniref:gliding motility-associated C-terminal domain-containing protein n=1 Tax=Flavobacterium sp. CG_9.10 TaxID=2787729 RepID=UPI0018C9F9BE|nr:gliding motility-associated C-terminal domain-containing protein [Flavobacterium sp. CG_9.10]MBG6111952.1 gliding motility-associated-like protein [Flavobacterium sp. CG_9.10]
MNLKILLPSKQLFLLFLYILVFFFSVTKTNAQCAGKDNSITVCDIPNPSSKSINLFNLLGAHTNGGIWKDNLKSGGLNLFTGILNAQVIRTSGVYTYTYTVDNGSGCKDSATISVTIGAYSGITSPNVSVCSDNLNFNLFHAFDGNYLNPQSGGKWIDNNNTNALTGNLLNAEIAGVGSYSFTYTVPAIGTCPAQSSNTYVTIYPAPNPGIAANLLLCNTDNLALYSNLNLKDKLTGEDPNGTWAESSTNELSSRFDSIVDVQHIYNTFGAGVYNFSYSVLPTNPICDIKTSVVSIIIEELLDFTGANLVINSDICENEIGTARYKAVLNQGSKEIPNGSYYVTYEIAGISSTVTNTSVADFSNGVLVFDINRIYFPQVDNYNVSIKKVVKTGSFGACNNIIGTLSDVLHVYPLPRINNATLAIDPVCKGFGATVKISGDTNLTDGNYSVVYDLSGSNSAVAQRTVCAVTNGFGSFIIPANLIPKVGDCKILNTNITNLTTGCTNTSNLSKAFIIKALPEVPNLTLDIKDVCQNQPISVVLAGLGTLTNVILNFNLTGSNSATNQTVTVPVDKGNANFTIPAVLLANAGITAFVINDLIDNAKGCAAIISNGTKSFTINAIPNVIVSNLNFCKNENKTVANLLPNGSKFQWFDSLTSTTILGSSTLLASKNYYVKEVNATTGCESGRAVVNVTLNEVQTPILIQDGQNFCGLDKPTLQSLTANTLTNGTITWFDAAANGAKLPPTELLKEGFTYYGFDFSNTTNCYSNALAVTVSLTNCILPNKLFIPDGFSPNGDTVNETFKIPNIEFLFPDYSLEIYNRYGNLMYTGNKNKPNWDGKNSDSKIAIDGFAPNGIYFYIINYNKDNKSPEQGRLYLNR